MNTRKKLTLALCIAACIQTGAYAQSSSYDLNNTPVTGTDNSAFGAGTLFSNTTGFHNTAVGTSALYFNSVSGADGYENTAVGWHSLHYNDKGFRNTASGFKSLYSNTDGNANSAFGGGALESNTTGSDNTATGFAALFRNTTGGYNTGIGKWSLEENVTGSYNSGLGFNSLNKNTTGTDNTGLGTRSLFNNTTGNYNSGLGVYSLDNNTTGTDNTGLGAYSLLNNINGNLNTGLGAYSDVGAATVNNATAIGSNAIVTISDKIRFGDAAVSIVEGPVAYTVSDGRFKTNVTETDIKGLDFILKLRPVVYNFETRKFQEFLTQNMSEEMKQNYFKKDFTKSTAIRQSGFIAQEVEAAAKEANYDFNGVHKPENANDNYSLAYGQFVVPLVKAVQEQQQMIEEQKQINETLNASVAAQQKQIEDLKNMVAALAGQPANNDTKGTLIPSDITVYPNPSKGSFMVNTKTIDNGTLEVTDVLGQKIQTLTLKKNTFSYRVDLTAFAKGQYLISVISNGKTLTQKIIID